MITLRRLSVEAWAAIVDHRAARDQQSPTTEASDRSRWNGRMSRIRLGRGRLAEGPLAAGGESRWEFPMMYGPFHI